MKNYDKFLWNNVKFDEFYEEIWILWIIMDFIKKYYELLWILMQWGTYSMVWMMAVSRGQTLAGIIRI
jgi:hypothetical protein